MYLGCLTLSHSRSHISAPIWDIHIILSVFESSWLALRSSPMKSPQWIMQSFQQPTSWLVLVVSHCRLTDCMTTDCFLLVMTMTNSPKYLFFYSFLPAILRLSRGQSFLWWILMCPSLTGVVFITRGALSPFRSTKLTDNSNVPTIRNNSWRIRISCPDSWDIGNQEGLHSQG